MTHRVTHRSCCPVQHNYNGVFATHQHELFDARLGLHEALQHTRNKCMGTAHSATVNAVTGRAECFPTFQLQDGVCTKSLALEVALEEVRLAAGLV